MAKALLVIMLLIVGALSVLVGVAAIAGLVFQNSIARVACFLGLVVFSVRGCVSVYHHHPM